MTAGRTLGQFYPVGSPLHELDARAKILATGILAVGLFLVDSATGLLLIAAAVVAPLPPIWAWLATAASLLVVLAVVRAVRRGFVPVDDDAAVELRAYDVLSSHPPLIGAVSSASSTPPPRVARPPRSRALPS